MLGSAMSDKAAMHDAVHGIAISMVYTSRQVSTATVLRTRRLVKNVIRQFFCFNTSAIANRLDCLWKPNKLLVSNIN